MKLAALFSGGKDSTFAGYKAREEGNEISCLVTVFPKSEESHLLHYQNISMTRLQAQAMKIPQLVVQVDSDDTELELQKLDGVLRDAKEKFGIQGVVHGGIQSKYQKSRFDKVCQNLGLGIIAPLWGIDQANYIRELVKSGFRFIITSVTAGGLDNSWLGKEITSYDAETLIHLASKHGFNVSFEGGEAETFVIYCPMFSAPIKIIKSNTIWDGYRGRFEITEAVLDQ